jgi:hypothetical protein
VDEQRKNLHRGRDYTRDILPDAFTTCPWRLERCAQEQLGAHSGTPPRSGPSGPPFVTLPFGRHFVLRFAIARGTMAEQKFQDIWKEQCVAARSVRAQHGILSAWTI